MDDHPEPGAPARPVVSGAGALALSTIVPCFNEEANLPELVRRLDLTYRGLGVTAETVLVDDASTDSTFLVASELQGTYPHLRVVRHERNQGLFAAWLTGLDHAAGELVAFIDADLQYQPEDIGRLWAHRAWTHSDVVQGARINVEGPHGVRFWLSRGLNALLNLAFRMSLHDNKSGFFLTQREIARDILHLQRRYRYPQTFVMVAARAKGYSIAEIKTFFAARVQGSSFIPRVPAGVVASCVLDILRALGEFRRRAPAVSYLGRKLQACEPPAAPEPPRRRPRLARHLRSMPLHAWGITADVGHYFAQLERSQWLAPEQVAQIQSERLQLLVRHAYAHVPWYRQRMDEAGIDPGRVTGIADLAGLPPLTKDDIRSNLHVGLLADNVDPGELSLIKTSGSTGSPLACYVDRSQLEMRWATTLRSLEWTGYRFGDPSVRLWHQTMGLSHGQAVRERLDGWLSNRLFIPAYEMTSANLADVIRRIVRHRPVLIDGYAESFNLLAQYLEARPVHCPSLRGIMSSAQTLPANSRAIIEQAFGAPVFDKYGAREFSGIAYECDRHQGHHVAAESYIVEIITDGRPARPGEIGEVFVTDLNNRAMPFIRYRLGDLARAATRPLCSCGRGLPLIGEVMGRTQAIIIGTNNRFLPGTMFAHLFKDYDFAIRRFQVVQERLGAIELRIVKGGRFSRRVLDELLATLHHFVGADMQIDVRFFDDLELVRTGKFQHSISTLAFDFQTLSVRPAELAGGAPSPEDRARDGR